MCLLKENSIYFTETYTQYEYSVLCEHHSSDNNNLVLKVYWSSCDFKSKDLGMFLDLKFEMNVFTLLLIYLRFKLKFNCHFLIVVCDYILKTLT